MMMSIPDLSVTSPEMIRKEVIPMMVRMGEEGKRSGTITEAEIALLNETSLIRVQSSWARRP